jgi:hypothetical protein
MDMKRLDFCSLVVVLLAAAAGCKGDPTSDLRKGVSQLGLNPDLMFIDSGTTKSFEVVPRDQQLNPVATAVTVTSSDPAIMTVAPDATSPSADNARQSFIVTAVAPGETQLVVTAAGVTSSATVTVLLPEVPFAISNTTPKGGELITVHATATHKFTDSTEVLFGGGAAGLIHFFSPDSIVVVAPFSTPGTLTLTNVKVLYHAGLVQDLPSVGRVTVTGDLWPRTDSSYAAAPDLFSILPLPAVGDSVHTITNFDIGLNNKKYCGEAYDSLALPVSNRSTGPCVIYQFTVPGPDSLNLLFKFDWDTGADIDAYACSAPNTLGETCDFESGGSAASGRKPETLRNISVGGVRTPAPFKYPPGTHYIGIEVFGGTKPSNVYLTIYRK